MFLGIRGGPPIRPDHFRSYNQTPNHSRADPTDCQRWGLSCWLSLEGARTAQKNFSYMAKWHIASGDMLPSDGMILPTPHDENPDHHTFWVAEEVALAPRFQIVAPPLI
jgi:hypothetical protein